MLQNFPMKLRNLLAKNSSGFSTFTFEILRQPVREKWTLCRVGQNVNSAGSCIEVKDILGQLSNHIGLGSGWAHWAVGAQTNISAQKWSKIRIFVSAVDRLIGMIMEKFDYMPESPSDELLRYGKKERQF